MYNLCVAQKLQILEFLIELFFDWTLATSVTSRGRNINLIQAINFSWICQFSFEILFVGHVALPNWPIDSNGNRHYGRAGAFLLYRAVTFTSTRAHCSLFVLPVFDIFGISYLCSLHKQWISMRFRRKLEEICFCVISKLATPAVIIVIYAVIDRYPP